jgi:hypothetical protein
VTVDQGAGVGHIALHKIKLTWLSRVKTATFSLMIFYQPWQNLAIKAIETLSAISLFKALPSAGLVVIYHC